MASKLQNGFLLLELLLALTVLSCLVIFVAQYQVMSILWQKNAAQHTSALMQARVLMEQLLAGETVDTNKEIDGIKLSWKREAVDGPVGSFDNQLQEVPSGFFILQVDAQWKGACNSSLRLIRGFYQHAGHDE
jgi:type II secretory pathway pseudopilin PulG